jgi:hypothetical protein
MPDISMCESVTCPLAKNCYRNGQSGTKPSEYMQAYFLGLTKEGEDCYYYWPMNGETE